MALQIGDQAPNFTANTTVGKIDFHEWLGDSWGVFMSHPADFTPVCTTEIGRVANLKSEFEKRNAKPLVVSVGTKEGLTPIESHTEWIKDVNETQNANVEFPLVEDPNKEIANFKTCPYLKLASIYYAIFVIVFWIGFGLNLLLSLIPHN